MPAQTKLTAPEQIPVRSIATVTIPVQIKSTALKKANAQSNVWALIHVPMTLPAAKTARATAPSPAKIEHVIVTLIVVDPAHAR